MKSHKLNLSLTFCLLFVKRWDVIFCQLKLNNGVMKKVENWMVNSRTGFVRGKESFALLKNFPELVSLMVNKVSTDPSVMSALHKNLKF